MPEPDSKRERSPLVIAALIASLPVLYVLSVGPAAWLQRHGIDEGNRFFWVYSPIHYLAEHSQVFREFMRWCISLWGA